MVVYFEKLKQKRRQFSSVKERQTHEAITGTKKGVLKKWARVNSVDCEIGMQCMQWSVDEWISFLKMHVARFHTKAKRREDVFVRKQLLSKLQSYKDQDEQQTKELVRRLLPSEELTTFSNYCKFIQQLFIDTQMQCYYCLQTVSIIYNTTYDSKQWSLDRLNNYHPHVLENVILSCLQCNIRRGCQSSFFMKHHRHSRSWSIISLVPEVSISTNEEGST